VKTIILSTSSLWNCGDDFIRDGLLELLQLRPDVRTLWWNKGYGITNSYANNLDVNLPLVDYFIVAGTPQWIYKNERIYRYCLKKDIPLSIVGVGTRNVVSSSHCKLMTQVAKSGLCEVALARDCIAVQALREFGFQNVELILDPCFFKRPLNRERTMNILGWRKQFTFGNDPSLLARYPHNVTYTWLVNKVLKRRVWSKRKEAYNKLMVHTFSLMPQPKTVIAHDNREIEEAQKLFGSKNVFYSSDYREIFKRYGMARSYVGSRIHGAIPSLIHGAPIHLIYTNKKILVMENAIDILSTYIKDIYKSVKMSYFAEEEIEPIQVLESPISSELLDVAITKEKKRVRNILKSQLMMSSFML